jgi:hypothetical protein
MSTPNSNELPKDVFAEIIDSTFDVINRQYGKHTAKNITNNTCGGKKPIRECATTSVLSEQLIKKVAALEPDSLEIDQSKLFATGIEVTAEIKCEECSLMCHAATRLLDGKTNERIRYVFEDPDAPNRFKDTKPIIATSFDGEYYKLEIEPGQLA